MTVPILPPACNNSTCVYVTETPEGIEFTSTRGADKGRVVYAPAEVAKFLADVKAGAYDHLDVNA